MSLICTFILCLINNIFFGFILILGFFHIELSFFKAVGKFLDESGGPHLLVESGILASGSLRGFIEGSNYKRCKRVHSLLCLAMQSFHFEEFLRSQTSITGLEITTFLRRLNNEKSSTSLLESLPKEMEELFKQYGLYSEETLKGKHGPTAQYWMTYIRMIDDHRKATRAVRTGDAELLKQILPQFIKLMFSFSHQNYARWLTKCVYYLNFNLFFYRSNYIFNFITGFTMT